MTMLDANLLLYAYNADAPHHSASVRWLHELLGSGEQIALPWVTIWAFIRIATNSRIWPGPMPAERAFAIVEQWIAQPGVAVVAPGPRHADILKRLTREYGLSGAAITDAVLAALALENGAVLASTDKGFRRFSGLRWSNPLVEP